MDADEHRGPVVLVHAFEVGEDRLGGDRVQGGDRLVGEHDPGLLDAGAGDGDALLLAAAELVASRLGLVREAHGLQRVVDQLVVGLREEAEQ